MCLVEILHICQDWIDTLNMLPLGLIDDNEEHLLIDPQSDTPVHMSPIIIDWSPETRRTGSQLALSLWCAAY